MSIVQEKKSFKKYNITCTCIEHFPICNEEQFCLEICSQVVKTLHSCYTYVIYSLIKVAKLKILKIRLHFIQHPVTKSRICDNFTSVLFTKNMFKFVSWWYHDSSS